MPREQRTLSRRDLVKGVAIGATLVVGGLTLGSNTRVRDWVVEKGKGFAEPVREIPGLGYSGRPISLTDVVDGRTVLAAERAEPGYWRGAPALEYDGETDRLLTHVRHRNPEERGYRVSIYHVDRGTLDVEELVSIPKRRLDARSMEGGDLIAMDGGFRWILSYQHDEIGDWRIHERRARSLTGLLSEGWDLDVPSSYVHNKDPAVVNGDLFVSSSSGGWLQSRPERVTHDEGRARTTELAVRGAGNARVTGGGILGREVFADTWPNFPGTDVSNVLWTTDERNSVGSLRQTAVNVDPSEQYVSPSGGSVTYVDAERVDDWVYLLWQEGRQDGSKDLVGARITIGEYWDLF